ncbi:hypothetical protein T492DRAFT_854031 [Pavlovales sp. CCMP2436]|nr:hypothetical protein T492DRAFT_854031 [Pavlovales sp. CCMP2436]
MLPVGRYDDWQACLKLIGVGGSGKTTVTEAVLNAGYSSDQIGYISNTIEKNFPFESLVKSSVVVAADVDKELMSNLSQTDLHKIINGERVEINIKYGGRMTMQWVAPFMLVSNVVPNWQDDQGQMTWRIVYFDFSKKPTSANSQLATELKNPLVQVQILLRCSKTYRDMAERYKYDGIMPNILAKYYPRRAAVASRVQQDNDPLVHFISELLVYTPGCTVSMRNLRHLKAKFCEEHDYNPTSIAFRKAFQNIVESKGMKVYSLADIASSRFKGVYKTAFIEHCAISVNFALMDEDAYRIGSASALLDASYLPFQKQVGEYKLDKRFSTADTRVYQHKSGPTIDNALVAIGLGHLGQRHKKARLLTAAVEHAYRKPANAIGHSLGGRLAETSGARGQITTYNKAAGLGDLFKKTSDRQLDVRNGRDAVSALAVTQRGGQRATIAQDTRGITRVGDLLNAHKLSNLSAAASAAMDDAP